MSNIEFRGVSKFFGDFRVLKDTDFSVDGGEVVVVTSTRRFLQVRTAPQTMTVDRSHELS